MKVFSKVMILAMITLLSGASYAADKVGENKSSDCPEVATNSAPKKQDSKAAASEEGKKDSKGTKAE